MVTGSEFIHMTTIKHDIHSFQAVTVLFWNYDFISKYIFEIKNVLTLEHFRPKAEQEL